MQLNLYMIVVTMHMYTGITKVLLRILVTQRADGLRNEPTGYVTGWHYTTGNASGRPVTKRVARYVTAAKLHIRAEHILYV